jgi:glycosyltransferase involved in cell wall biosynthesis
MHNMFTIVIPTRERCKTLKYALQTCIDQQYENFEIIVSDNFSQDNTKATVDTFDDPRIRYINPGRRVSMSENFDFALKHVKDGFVMFIGDDDGIYPNAIEHVNKIVNEHNVKAVLSSVSGYVWPNHPDISKRNNLCWSAGNEIEIRQSSEWIKKFLNFESIYTFDLVGLYMAFVHTDVIKLVTKGEFFFRSITPDAYSAFACTAAVKQYAYSQRPFCIAGASASSNGASYLTQENKVESDMFLKENNIQFHSKLRNCPSFKVIASEAFLQFKDVFPEYASNYFLDIKKLLAITLHEGGVNDVTKTMIKNAVKEMALENKIDLDTLKWESPKKSFTMSHFLSKVKNSIPKMTKYVSINDAREFSVFNVYDAAKVGNTLMDINNGFKVNRHFDLLKNSFINKIKQWM